MTNSTQPQPRANSATSVLRRLIMPPVFPDEEKTRVARTLNASLLIVFVIAALYSIVSLMAGDDVPSIILSGITTLFTAGIWILMRSGHVRLASALLSLMLLVNIALAVYINGTIRAPITATFVLGIVLAGSLISTRAAVGMLLVTACHIDRFSTGRTQRPTPCSFVRCRPGSISDLPRHLRYRRCVPKSCHPEHCRSNRARPTS